MRERGRGGDKQEEHELSCENDDAADESGQGGRAGLIRPARRRAGKEWRAGGRQALDGSECLCRSVSVLFVVLCKKLFCE